MIQTGTPEKPKYFLQAANIPAKYRQFVTGLICLDH
jgi:hypothetical protein